MIARENQIIALTPTADHTGYEGYAVRYNAGAERISSATTVPLGIITEGAKAPGKDSIALPGYAGTVKVKLHSSASVAAFAYLELCADGTFKTVTTTEGNIRFCQALEAGAANELIEARLTEPYLIPAA